MTARGWGVVAVALVVAGVIAWRVRDSRLAPQHLAAQRARLDPAALRTRLAAGLERARHVRARPTPRPALPPPPSGSWPLQGLGALPHAGHDLVAPTCVLGPGALCTALADLIAGCDGGDADDCLAVGEYLADTPPRPLIANVFFMQACRIGDGGGCERFYALHEPSDAPCDEDAFACAWRAYRSHDPALADQACSLGAADACVVVAELATTDPDRARTYLERACQLGSAAVCMELGLRLAPGCTPGATQICYAPDPTQSEAAFQMACSAGWAAACDRLSG
jgi:TPR repeat protein